VSERLLEVTELRKVYQGRRGDPDRVAVDQVSFVLNAGESIAIVGNSGSGKTTTLRMIAGLERPSAGELTVCGRPRSQGRASTRERRRRARETQLVFQDPYASLDPRRPVAEDVGAVLDLHFRPDRASRSQQVARLLDQVGLSERHAPLLPGALSGGERQRVAIARALAAQPRVLLLDEPVASLDVSIQAQILNLLTEIRRATGIACLFVSHDLGVVRQVCDQIMVMRDGRIVERGATATIFEEPHEPYTKLLLDSIPRPGWKPTSSRANSREPRHQSDGTAPQGPEAARTTS
jgi:oligopeptide transport system ATP-binding protein